MLKLGVPGEDLPKVSYKLVEADTFADHDILVVGGGDSAIEAALGLSRSDKNRVTLSYRGEGFHRARERNREYLEKAERDSHLRILLQSSVHSIGRDQVELSRAGRTL